VWCVISRFWKVVLILIAAFYVHRRIATTEAGVVRVQFDRGWVSENTTSGQVILAKVEADESDSDEGME
jgi:hypothetical protein